VRCTFYGSSQKLCQTHGCRESIFYDESTYLWYLLETMAIWYILHLLTSMCCIVAWSATWALHQSIFEKIMQCKDYLFTLCSRWSG
jgi:hypothetical protein